MRLRFAGMMRRGWLYLLVILVQFIPPYASKPHGWEETPKVIAITLSNALVFSCPQIYPLFKVLPIVLIALVIAFRSRVARIFDAYVGITYVLFAVLQGVAITDEYGLTVITGNLLMMLIVSTVWFWDVFAQKNDFMPVSRPLWRYWVVPPALLAFWFPLNPETLMPDFNPVYLFTNVAGLTFCMMTPVYISILTLYYPRCNTTTLSVTSLAGTIIGFYNVMWNFIIFPEKLWWNGVLHIPLLTISIYGLALPITRPKK